MNKKLTHVKTPGVRRRQIEDAALRVFARRGVRHATVDEVVDEAGISKGLVYLYYKGKDSLIEAVMKRLFEPDVRQARRLIHSAGTARDRLLVYARSFAADVERYRLLVPLFFDYYAMLSRNRHLREITAEYYGEQQGLLRTLLRQGIAAGEFADDTDAETAASSLLALQEGMILRWMIQPEAADWRTQAEQAVRMLLNGLKSEFTDGQPVLLDEGKMTRQG